MTAAAADGKWSTQTNVRFYRALCAAKCTFIALVCYLRDDAARLACVFAVRTAAYRPRALLAR